MNHYVNGVSNVSMVNGVITFNFNSNIQNEKGEMILKDEVQITMDSSTFNDFINICSKFIEKVKEQSRVKTNKEETIEELAKEKKLKKK